MSLKQLSKYLSYMFQEDGSNQNCVFWDFNLNEKKGGWSSEGCIYDGRINGREVCLCDHLTNFAVLLVIINFMVRWLCLVFYGPSTHFR